MDHFCHGSWEWETIKMLEPCLNLLEKSKGQCFFKGLVIKCNFSEMTCHVTLKSAVFEHIQRRSIVHFGVYMEYTTTLPNCSLTIRLIDSLPNQVLRDGVSIQLLRKYGSHVCLYIYIRMYDNCFWNLSKAAHLCL